MRYGKRRVAWIGGWAALALWLAASSAAWAQDGGGTAPERPPVPQPQDEGPGDKQKEGDGGTEARKQQRPTDLLGNYWPLLVVLGLFIVMMVFSSRNRRKQQAQHREMLGNLKKGDKVTSIGGICGTVVEVREAEVIVKIDDTGNTRLRLARWAIRGVGEAAKTEAPEQKR